MKFKKNMLVSKIIEGFGSKVYTTQLVERVSKGKVFLVDCSLEYDAETGYEINPVIPGFNSYIVPPDGR